MSEQVAQGKKERPGNDVVARYAAGKQDVSQWLNPVEIILRLWEHRFLIRQFTWREVIGRYRGSYLGLLWALLNPLFMLSIYTFIFAVIFGAKWGLPQEGKMDFAIVLFAGIITFNIFSEVVNSAPSIVLSSGTFVKKVVFPLEILPVTKLFSALINALFSTTILLFAILASHHSLPWTTLLLPLVWLPLLLLSLGLAYFLASIGTFVRDVGHFISLAVTVLFFISPIFFPMQRMLHILPQRLHIFYKLNPIAIFVEDTRRVLIFGTYPDWPWTLLMLVIGMASFVFGFIWFMKSKKAFADVL